MPKTVAFETIILSSREELLLGPPQFPKLRTITIHDFFDLPTADVPRSSESDMHLLRAMDPAVEALEIGTLRIFRGRLRIIDVDLLTVRKMYIGNDIPADREEAPIVAHRSRGSFKIRHVDTMHVQTLFNMDDVPTGYVDMVITLPPQADPSRKWSPVQVTTGFRSTG